MLYGIKYHKNHDRHICAYEYGPRRETTSLLTSPPILILGNQQHQGNGVGEILVDEIH